MGEAALKPVKIFVCCLNSNSSQPTLQVSGLNRATGFAQQTISSTHPPLGSSAARMHRLQTLSSALLVRGGQKTLSTTGGGGCDLAPCTGIGNLGSKASKTPPLRIRIRQICTPWSPPVRVYPQVSSIGEQSCSLGKQLGICRYKLSLPRSAKIPVMVVASPSPLHHRRSQGLSPTDFPLTS